MFWTVLEILVAAVLPFVFVAASGLPSSSARARWGKGYENRNARESLTQLDGWRKRAHYAQLNGHEAFAPFAAATLCAELTHVDPAWHHGLAIAFFVLRLGHGLAYMADQGFLRSTLWTLGAAAVISLFVLAARAASLG